MDTKKIKATLSQGKDKTLTLRIWLSEKDKQLFLLEKGKQANTVIANIIVMNGGDE